MRHSRHEVTVGFLLFASLQALPFRCLLCQDNPVPIKSENAGHAFVAAAQHGDENAVRRLLAEDPSLVDATDRLEMTALDWAATREHWHIFRQLLAAGAPVDRVGADGGTVLHRVCQHDRPEIVELLLAAGADLSVRNQWGRTPLHVAARRGCDTVAALLLSRGADPNAPTNEGWTPLHVAHRSGQPRLVELLLAAGADPERHDVAGRTPMEGSFRRPTRVPIDWASLFEYEGLYEVDDDFHFKVGLRNGRLLLQDFGTDTLYATGPDSFYCQSEPWSVTFLRDAQGAVSEIEVRFLRRAVRGVKRDSPLYVGSHVCRECHIAAELGNQYVQWLSSRHAAAYWRLATDWALFLARSRPHFEDMEDPQEDDRCLLCHTTAAQDPSALFAITFGEEEGVGCEACHGPGSNYAAADIMSDRSAFLAAGGRVPDEQSCLSCHRDADRFEFTEWWPRVVHPRARGSGPF